MPEGPGAIAEVGSAAAVEKVAAVLADQGVRTEKWPI